MRIVAIETTGRSGSVAALEADEGQNAPARVLAEIRLDAAGRTAQLLAPALDQLFQQQGWPPRSLDVVAVAIGPGSFTGLRIGVTTAKTLAYATGSQIVGVDTMEVLAAQSRKSASRLWTIIDAQRQELFAAQFESVAGGWWNQIGETAILAEERWLAGLSAGDHIIGPALVKMRERLPTGVHVVEPAECWQPQSSFVGLVAWQAFLAGHRDDVWKLAPRYLRASAAEEKKAQNR